MRVLLVLVVFFACLCVCLYVSKPQSVIHFIPVPVVVTPGQPTHDVYYDTDCLTRS